MVTNVNPRPGSVGERSIAWLRKNGRMNARDLAEGIDAEYGTLGASLNLCVQNKLVVREATDDGTFYSVPPLEVQAEQDELREAVHQLVQSPAEMVTADDVPVFSKTEVSALPGEPFGFKPKVSDGKGARVVPTNGLKRESLEVPNAGSYRVAPFTLESLKMDGTDFARAVVKPPDHPRHFELAIYSDGRMIIELGECEANLSQEETEKMFAWMRKVDSVRTLP